MLFLAIIGLAVPTIFASTMPSPSGNQEQVQLLSDALAVILLIVYILGIVFTFITHKHLSTQPPESTEDIQGSHGYSTLEQEKSFLFLQQAWLVS